MVGPESLWASFERELVRKRLEALASCPEVMGPTASFVSEAKKVTPKGQGLNQPIA